MNSRVEHPAVTRVRILLLTLVGAAIWVVLSVLGSSSPASAADDAENGDSLLGSVATAVDELPVVQAVASPIVTPVTAAVEQVTEPAAAALERVAPGAMTVTVDTLESVTVLLDSVIQPVIQPVLEQPLVATAVDLLTDADDDITAVLTGSAALSDTRTGASAPAMMRVAPIGHATAGTAVAVPGESHAVGDLVPPVTPTAPTSFDATAPAQNSAGHPLAAAIFDFNRATALSAATTSLQNDALPSSATFDTDCSPD